MVVQACAIVSAQWRTPTPTVDLRTVTTTEEVEYLVPGLIPAKETTVMYGDGESAKSLCALFIAACVRTGSMLPWGAVPKTGAVLYLDWETNQNTVALRLNRLAAGLGIPTPEIHYRECVRSLVDELPGIREDIRKIELVIVDSIGFAATGALVEDETARASMNALRQMAPATRLVVAHVSRSDADSTKTKVKPFGSAFFWNGMRSGIEVRRAEDQPDEQIIDVGLFHRKANDGRHHKPVALRVTFDGTNGPIGVDLGDVADVPELGARTALSTRIRMALVRGAKDTRTLAEELDEKEYAVRMALNKMRDVTRISAGGGRGKPTTWGLSG
jgi:hypothetical protein